MDGVTYDCPQYSCTSAEMEISTSFVQVKQNTSSLFFSIICKKYYFQPTTTSNNLSLFETTTTAFHVEEVDQLVSCSSSILSFFMLIFVFSQSLHQITCEFQVCTLQTEYDSGSCRRQASNCDICLETCEMVETLEDPCHYWTCSPRARINYKVFTFVLLGSHCGIVVLYSILISCRCKIKLNSVDALEVEVDQNERVEDVEQGQEALEEVNGLENHNVDFNEFGEDI